MNKIRKESRESLEYQKSLPNLINLQSRPLNAQKFLNITRSNFTKIPSNKEMFE